MNDSIITRKEQLQATQHALDESEKPTHDQAMQLINANEHVETVTQINQAYQQWMHALDRLEDAIFMHDKDFRILRCNRAYQQYAKLPFEQIIGQFYFDIFPKTEAPLCSCLVSAEEIMLQGNAEEIQVDDAIFNSYAYAIRDEEGTYLYSVHTIENITERKQAEQALLISSQKNRLLFESSRDALMTISPPLWHFTRANKAARQLFGISDIAEITSLGVLNISPEYQLDGDLSSVKAQQIIATAMEQGSNFFEWTHQRFNGDNFIADVLLTRMEVEGEDPFLQVTIRDISERKEAEQQIQQLTKIYATLSLCNHAITNSNTSQDLFEKICVYSVQAGGMMMAWIGLVHPKTNMVHAVASYGDKNHYLDGIEISTLATEPSGIGPTGTAIREDRPVWCQDFLHDGLTAHWHERAKVAGWKAAAALPIHLNGKVIGAFMLYSERLNVFDTMIQKLIIEMSMDISFALDTFKHEAERIEAEANLLKTENLLEEASAMALIGGWDIDAKTGQGTWTNESALIYDMKPNKPISIEICLQACEGEWLEKIQTAMDEAINKGIPFSLELPIKTAKGNEKWVRVIGSPIFHNGDVDHVHGSIQDITILKTSEQELHESLIGTIQAMTSTVEMRDSYTAGRQKRVAALSCAIAEVMGMDEKHLEGLQLAAQIHDLGKIYIPAEILSKPGKLSKIEFMLIQTHPQVGYDILKDIKFPWPIADIIFQHHEKLDGSGYPQGLKGDQVLLEAKIITVADVIEAISSHRPYRAALGIEVALNEIKRGRGSIYEVSIVDACVKLFSEKGFAFST